MAWQVWCVVAVALIAAHFIVPATHPVAQSVLYCAVSAGTAVALAAGIRLHRPRNAVVWWLLAIGQAMYVAGDIAYFTATAAAGTNGYPLFANALYLSQYGFAGAALVLLGRRRSPQRNTAAMIDTAILTVAAAVLWWVFLIHPAVAVPGSSPLDALGATIYPVADLCVLTVAIRLLLGGGTRQRSYLLLLINLGLTLLADTAYGLLSLHEVYVNGGWSDAVYLAAYVALGASALHPSMRHIAEPVETRSGATLNRVALLALATLMAPAVLLVQDLRHSTSSDLVVVTASAVLFLLVLTRMAALVSAQRRIAMTDGLTGVHTRRFLSEALSAEGDRAARRGTPIAMLLLDVDHFKRINDTYGHPAGDQVLVELARRLRRACRGTDVVARFGGEEFAVLVTRDHADLATLAERLRERIAEVPVVVNGRTAIPVTVSVGAAALPGGAGTEELLSAADAALYAAKRGGRNRVVVGGTGHAVATGDAVLPDPAGAPGPDEQIRRWTATVAEAARCRAADPVVPTSLLIGVCAAWAVMRRPGAGRAGLSAEQARDQLRRCRGVQFDPDAVDLFLELETAGLVGVPDPATTGAAHEEYAVS
ncbi:putative signaling protein [Actinoplanes sp. SE50]|nr:putative signaling protein [Actinoplanes sp. SE50/110]ATO83228.1 putative signaling protein [Actinoplanes sp. SE50]SLM00635.1 putative signaling protein [Actinoplanes sp. SE50/110]